ncbi:MAG TPA: L,D-transpeptidase [Jatrophihabitantaceae bacterium]|jgi:lipoprotein-anchoring transpeptidase ErfK/SrfK|nr:L,D-transpeptidase [Jatrophihabitantaceae bacterium]
MARWLSRGKVLVITGVAVVVAAGGVAIAVTGGHTSSGQGVAASTATAGNSTPNASPIASTPERSSGSSAPITPTPSPTGPRTGAGTPVTVRLYENDGQTFGVGMPIIAYFSQKITDASVFDKAVTVTVNGQPADGAWYWEPSSQSGEALEAHYRLPSYWPAHADIEVNMPIAGLWAGPGMVFADSLTLAMKTGPAQLAAVNGTPGIDTMTITSDGKPVRTLKVSLGETTTPTLEGTAVVMEKDNPQQMVSAPGEEPAYSISVPWSVRVTYDGEFIHDAYWNGEIGQQNLSHGCTNLSPADAQWYYGWSQIGDPVTWTHTGTSAVVPVTDGWGDWNLPWATYAAGGLLPPTS